MAGQTQRRLEREESRRSEKEWDKSVECDRGDRNRNTRKTDNWRRKTEKEHQ